MENAAERVAAEIAARLKQHGFLKRRRTWTRPTNDIVQVLNVQASEWSKDIFDINVGVYLKALGNLSHPPESKCHIRRRVPYADTDEMLKYSLNWLDNRSTIADIRSSLDDGDRREAVMIIARQYLGVAT